MAKINKGIVVTTSRYTKDWLEECLRSLPSKYPVLVVSSENYLPMLPDGFICDLHINGWNTFELGGIKKGAEKFNEFVYLMDTCVIKDTTLFDKLFEMPGHVFLTQGGFHYMGKFVSDDLPELPKVGNKAEAIQHETSWLGDKPRLYFNPNLPVISEQFEEKHGRINMVLSNNYLTKYKATWC